MTNLVTDGCWDHKSPPVSSCAPPNQGIDLSERMTMNQRGRQERLKRVEKEQTDRLPRNKEGRNERTKGAKSRRREKREKTMD